ADLDFAPRGTILALGEPDGPGAPFVRNPLLFAGEVIAGRSIRSSERRVKAGVLFDYEGADEKAGRRAGWPLIPLQLPAARPPAPPPATPHSLPPARPPRPPPATPQVARPRRGARAGPLAQNIGRSDEAGRRRGRPRGTPP